MIEIKTLFDPLMKPENRRNVILGGIISAALLYFIIWLPISFHVSDLRDDVLSQQNEIKNLQQAKVNILALRSQVQATGADSESSLLTVVDNTLRDQQVDGTISSLQEVNNDEVRLSFSSIAFDDLNTWLENLAKKQGVHVTRLNVSALESSGMVQATLVLHRG